MSDMKKKLGKRIREVRLANNLTQEKLAEMVDIGTPNISYIENGKFAPAIETLEKIAGALNVAPYELYMFESLKSAQEIKKEMYGAMDKDEKLLRLMYKIYRSVKYNLC